MGGSGGLWEPVRRRREVVFHHGATGGGPGAENAAFSTVYFGGFFPGGLAASRRGAMSAKKMSKMCNFVHKLCKNVHFFTQKRHFSTFFARGRGDFLAAPKMAKITKFGVATTRGFGGENRAAVGVIFLTPLNASPIESYLSHHAANKKNIFFIFLFAFNEYLK